MHLALITSYEIEKNMHLGRYCIYGNCIYKGLTVVSIMFRLWPYITFCDFSYSKSGFWHSPCHHSLDFRSLPILGIKSVD